MAKVVGPLHSTEARGSVDTLTYSTWRGIRTVRTRAGNSDPASGTRLEALLLGKAASFNWATIGDARRQAWERYSSDHPEPDWTGTNRRISGHAWYVRLHTRASLWGYPPIDDPPDIPVGCRLDSFRVATFPGVIVLTWTGEILDQTYEQIAELYEATNQSPGRKLTMRDATRKDLTLFDTYFFEFPQVPGTQYRWWLRAADSSGQAGPFMTCGLWLPP